MNGYDEDEVSGTVVAIGIDAQNARIEVETSGGARIASMIQPEVLAAIGIHVGDEITIIRKEGSVIIGK
jgi:molybdopterin-binding protein